MAFCKEKHMEQTSKARMILPYVLAFFFGLFGVVWHSLAPSKTALVILGILSLVPLFFLVGSMILAKQKINLWNNTPIAEGQAYLLRHRNDAKAASEVLYKELKQMRRKTALYALAMALCGVAAILFGGMMATVSIVFFLFCVAYGGTILGAALTRIPAPNPVTLTPEALVLKKEDYPLLYETAEKAADTLGSKGQILILLSFDCNASIARSGNCYYLQLGIIYLSVLSQEELYAICLHEFSHCTDKNQEVKKQLNYGEWLATQKAVSGPILFAANLFSLSDILYLFKHMVYSYASSILTETKADMDMAKYGTPEAAASSLLKINHYDFFHWEDGVEDEPCVYESETPSTKFLRQQIEKFIAASKERREIWDECLKKEILPNNASHPILRMRLETLGVKEFSYIPPEFEGEWAKELDQALTFADEKLATLHDNYEKEREEQYLAPLRRVAEWKEQGMPISAETYSDILSDLRSIGKNQEALALCDRVIKELDNTASPFAYYIKGCALLRRYDAKGVDMLYQAIENNHNFLEDGLMQIGEYFCKIGDEENLAEYRRRALEFAQKDKDEYSDTGFLSPKDQLSADDMPLEMREKILQFILSVSEDIIDEVYLVRKTVNENFFTSAFVIHFYGGTDKQREAIMHKIFCFLDTYPAEWHFSLFDYFEYPQIKFSKIKGSLVFSKKEKNHVN